MSNAVKEMAAELEEHASSRANFQNVSDDDRWEIARELTIARAQAQDPNSDVWEKPPYREAMRRKKEVFHHRCGKAGIPIHEANYIWWNAVYGGVPPYQRNKVV